MACAAATVDKWSVYTLRSDVHGDLCQCVCSESMEKERTVRMLQMNKTMECGVVACKMSQTAK